MIKRNTNPLIRAVKQKTLLALLTDYLDACASGDPSAKKKELRFPNRAGFCRALGCGLGAFSQFSDAYPHYADWIRAVFEDETLNASLSPTLLTAYLKRRLGYTEKNKADETEADCGLMRLVFEHDITEDGE